MFRLLVSACLICSTIFCSAQRQTVPLNEGWTFSAPEAQGTATPVQLPHTWNADDVLTKGANYARTVMTYRRQWDVPADWKGKRVFLRFDGVNSVASVSINQQNAGSHEGGYTAFCLDVTNLLNVGKANTLTVKVSNVPSQNVLPIAGDFNVYGGIHRPVSVIVTEQNCITPLDFASAGVYVHPTKVSAKSATVSVQTKLSLKAPAPSLRVLTSVTDASGKKLLEKSTTPVSAEAKATFTLPNPHLWQGKADPYLYSVTVKLMDGDQVLDEITQPMGLRYFRADPAGGFFLNGQYLDLHGVSRHEDVAGRGSALQTADHDRDMSLVQELGATALRLSHYPHSPHFYDLCDRNGLVVWSEIPLIGAGGSPKPGYVNTPALQAHARQVMTELIRQNYNHPSICFWGLENGLRANQEDPQPFLIQLKQLVKTEDPYRLTTLASSSDDLTFSTIPDAMSWNKYYGWYGGTPEQLGTWADATHQKLPAKAIGVSEYGAGGSINHHEDTLRIRAHTPRWHPESWQAYFHELSWNELKSRPFIWGKFVWILADFGSASRTEGDTNGINDKGLVTYDRQTKKDAFYFYKANWNPAPLLYIANRRHETRAKAVTTVKVYANVPDVELLVNGESQGKHDPDDLHIIRWANVQLRSGQNQIVVRAIDKRGKPLQDSCTWTMVAP